VSLKEPACWGKPLAGAPRAASRVAGVAVEPCELALSRRHIRDRAVLRTLANDGPRRAQQCAERPNTSSTAMALAGRPTPLCRGRPSSACDLP